MTFLMLAAMVIVGLIASAVEHIIASVIGTFLGGNFAFAFINYLTFPGTILHELSHAVFATLTGARVTEISFFDFGITLGHVNYIPRGPKLMRELQNCLTACAPVITGTVALYFLFKLLTITNSTIGYVGVIYLIVSVITHMSMSIMDVINYFRGIRAGALFFALLNLIFLVIL